MAVRGGPAEYSYGARSNGLTPWHGRRILEEPLFSRAPQSAAVIAQHEKRLYGTQTHGFPDVLSTAPPLSNKIICKFSLCAACSVNLLS